MCFGIATAHAATINTFTTLASWQTAAGGSIVTENFADSTLIPGLSITFGTNIPAGSIGGGVYDDIAVTQVNDAKNPKINFSPATFAFGGDWDLAVGGRGAGLELHLTFSDNSTADLFISNPAAPNTFSGFFGFVSDTAVKSILINSGTVTGQEEFTMDNAYLPGGTTAVPEPSSLILLGTGILFGVTPKLRKKLFRRAQ
jgi:hypothetical protein